MGRELQMFRDTLYLRTSRVKQSVLGLPDTVGFIFRVQAVSFELVNPWRSNQ